MTARHSATEALVQSQRPGTTLASLVATRRADHVSWDLIAREVRQITGEYIHGETLRGWHQRPCTRCGAP